MGEIASEHNYCLYWHDDKQAILVFEITDRWTWEEARSAIERLNQTIQRAPGEVYTIYNFAVPHSGIIPAGNILPNLQQLMETELEQEVLLIFVGAHFLQPIRRFMEIIVATFPIKQAQKFQFADSMEAAHALIRMRKQKSA